MQMVTLSFNKDKRFRCKTHRFQKFVARLKRTAHSRYRMAESRWIHAIKTGDLEAELHQPMPVSGWDICQNRRPERR